MMELGKKEIQPGNTKPTVKVEINIVEWSRDAVALRRTVSLGTHCFNYTPENNDYPLQYSTHSIAENNRNPTPRERTHVAVKARTGEHEMPFILLANQSAASMVRPVGGPQSVRTFPGGNGPFSYQSDRTGPEGPHRGAR